MRSDTPGSSIDNNAVWLKSFFRYLAVLILAGLFILIPYSFLWLYDSGDAALERVVEAQAKGDFALFGSGLSQDFVDYKLKLYDAIKPDIIAIGSSRVMQFRGAWFQKPFLNMGGAAGNLAVLRSTIDALLKIKKPQAIILGLDFWWFMPQWEKEPEKIIIPGSGTYNYSLESLKKPWEWLLTGKITLKEFFAPILGAFGQGFRADRYGIMAQQTNDGFGPDGSWYYTAEISGLKNPVDYQFQNTLALINKGIRAFYHAHQGQEGPSEAHIDALADLLCRLRSRGIKTFVFIPPLAAKTLEEMRQNEKAYPHLFNLKNVLSERGIEVADFSDAKTLGSNDCEFIDGFHGGAITYARILRHMADRWPALLVYVNMEKLDNVIRDWKGHATIPDARITNMPEIDFMHNGCVKKSK